MSDKIVNHFVLADGSVARYDAEQLAGTVPELIFSPPISVVSGQYISGTSPAGNISLANATAERLECYTDFIDLSDALKITFDIEWETSVAVWLAYVVRYKTATGSTRVTAVSTTANNAHFELDVTDTMMSVAFSYRSFGNYQPNITIVKKPNPQKQVSLVKAINHMGYHYVYTENTINAFKESAKRGFKYVETDVQWTSDNIPVIMHDGTVDRTTNGTGSVSAMTFEELQTLTCKDGVSKVPSAEEFFKYCKRSGLHPYVECNQMNEPRVKRIMRLAYVCGLKGNITFLINNTINAQYYVTFDNSARLGIVKSTLDSTLIDEIISLKTGYNEVFADVHTIDADLRETLANNGIKLEQWTLDDPLAIYNLDSSVTGVTSNTLRADKMLFEYYS